MRELAVRFLHLLLISANFRQTPSDALGESSTLLAIPRAPLVASCGPHSGGLFVAIIGIRESDERGPRTKGKRGREGESEGKYANYRASPCFLGARFHYACWLGLEWPPGSYPCTSGSTGIKTSIVDIVSWLQRRRVARKEFNEQRNATPFLRLAEKGRGMMESDAFAASSFRSSLSRSRTRRDADNFADNLPYIELRRFGNVLPSERGERTSRKSQEKRNIIEWFRGVSWESLESDGAFSSSIMRLWFIARFRSPRSSRLSRGIAKGPSRSVP